jgi:hypothetical protein
MRWAVHKSQHNTRRGGEKRYRVPFCPPFDKIHLSPRAGNNRLVISNDTQAQLDFSWKGSVRRWEGRSADPTSSRCPLTPNPKPAGSGSRFTLAQRSPAEAALGCPLFFHSGAGAWTNPFPSIHSNDCPFAPPAEGSVGHHLAVPHKRFFHDGWLWSMSMMIPYLTLCLCFGCASACSCRKERTGTGAHGSPIDVAEPTRSCGLVGWVRRSSKSVRGTDVYTWDHPEESD